ncbi:primary-amine oxidase [Amycolatopsis methanolica 239]|uniref:Amine oxidase n=1 Tax=Amycolatopsis methanolica 239 TaxID=1068978 RepID=A0A076MU98_AMYME|nr:tyramine oxidase [Amycolatopsis methanolica]AIJ21417.1 primary-amine oxidase [Amycolatopsis methanolica 239]
MTDRRAPHPLAPLTANEITGVRNILETSGAPRNSTRFSYVGLVEPAKSDVARYELDGAPVPRRARALLLDTASGDAEEVLVDLTADAVGSRTPVTGEHGQVPVLTGEHELVREIMAADEEWCAALRERGIDDPAQVYLAALSAGRFTGDEGRRLVRVLAHRRPEPSTMVWAHPVDGLVAFVDLIAREVVEIVDTGAVPIPAESGDYDDPAVSGPARTTQRPIEITQPDGPRFTLEDGLLTWENWQVRVGFDMREGLVLHQLGFSDGGRLRPVVHRASVAEMVVPYADPGPIRFWQNYFGTGEYQLGKLSNSLELGCDCLGEITYVDAIVADDEGKPVTLANAICIHEEDAGVLWKHTDPSNGSRQTRRQRRLVVSFFVTVGNYDYGSTGASTWTARSSWSARRPGSCSPPPTTSGSRRTPRRSRPDGDVNAVEEVEMRRVPMGPSNPHGHAFTRSVRRLSRESEAQRMAAPDRGRVWHIVNPERVNRVGEHPGYALMPEGLPVLLADEGSSIHGRATFATKHLWVTRFAEDERYPAGDLVNQSPPGEGLPAYTSGNRDIDGADLVVWHTFGLTHFRGPRTGR